MGEIVRSLVTRRTITAHRRVGGDVRIPPHTRHKRNYYYARYSHIPFKAFGRTFGDSDCRGGYYPIELIRSSPRAMSYEPSYDILYLLTNGTWYNKKRLARREPR